MTGDADAYASTRAAWDAASEKHVREYDDLLAEARTARLLPVEERVLAPFVAGARIVHPQSGHGIDDAALVRLGAHSVLGLDYSPTAVGAARRRAEELGLPVRYEVVELPATGLAAASFDVVYTGKGALPWMRDLDAWAAEMARLLVPGGVLFVYESHPLTAVLGWDADVAAARDDRSYFARSHVVDSFPDGGATEWQTTFAQIVMTVQRAGFAIEHLEEHPDPFWKPGDVEAAAWDGRLPNAFSLLARRIG